MPEETRHQIRGSSTVYRAMLIAAPWVISVAAGIGALGGNVPWWVPAVVLLSAPVPLWTFGRMPHEIRTDDDGLIFNARLRTIRVPWDELVEIRNAKNHPMWLEWRWSNGSIVTHAQLSDGRELLRIAERRARSLRSTP